jgi:hypothetical protein
MNDIAENDIRNIDVLVFRVDNATQAEYFDYRVEGSSIVTTDTNEKQFTVTLRKNDTTDCRLVFLANVRDELTAMTMARDTRKELLLERLLSYNSGAWPVETDTYRPFPMWGESDKVRIDDGLNLRKPNGITLLRSVVSVEVYADNATVTPRFTLEDVYLYNRKVYGRVAPDGIKYIAVDRKVKAPSIPTVNMTLPLNVPTPLHYPVTPTEHKLTHTIYTYEADSVNSGDDFSATCLVVGGIYVPDGRKQYYRLDFMVKDSEGKFKSYHSLLRNHRYQFIINSVSGDGHNTPDSAFYGKKGNMGVEILAWNLADINNVVVKEMHMLSLNRSSLEVTGQGVFYVGVETDHPEGWTAVPEDAWISVDKQNGYMKITLSTTAPSGGRTGYINVRAGNMTKRFKLVQKSL